MKTLEHYYKLYSGQNCMFQLFSLPDCLDEIHSFIDATPDNKYLYDFNEIANSIVDKYQGVLLIGVAPQSERRPIRGVTIIWSHKQNK